MDNLLIALVIAVVAGVSNWLQRRAQSQQESTDKTPGLPPRPLGPPPQRRMVLTPAHRPAQENVLERELRRLVGGEAPPEVSTPRARSLPPHGPPKLASVPTKVVVPAQRAPQAPAPKPVVKVSSVPEKSARISDSSTGFGRAQDLQGSVARHFQQVDQRTANALGKGPIVNGRSSSTRGFSLAALTRNRAALKQAFVASLVFGPPKANEQGSDAW